jgi:hypothetical protein
VFLRLPTWILVAVAFACHVHLFLAARQGTGAFSRFHARLLTTGTVALLLAIVTAPLLWAGSFAKFLHQRTVTCADGGGCGGLETWVGPGWFFAWIILPLVAILQRGAFDETPGTERKPTATDGSNVP